MCIGECFLMHLGDQGFILSVNTLSWEYHWNPPCFYIHKKWPPFCFHHVSKINKLLCSFRIMKKIVIKTCDIFSILPINNPHLVKSLHYQVGVMFIQCTPIRKVTFCSFKKYCLIHMFALCITPYTKIYSDSLHYISFWIYIIFILFLKIKGRSNANRIINFNCEILELTLNNFQLIQIFFPWSRGSNIVF